MTSPMSADTRAFDLEAELLNAGAQWSAHYASSKAEAAAIARAEMARSRIREYVARLEADAAQLRLDNATLLSTVRGLQLVLSGYQETETSQRSGYE